MGHFRMEIVAIGGHGCQRKEKEGETFYGCGGESCPDCMFARFVQQMRRAGMNPEKAEFTHWPGDLPGYSPSGEVRDDYAHVPEGAQKYNYLHSAVRHFAKRIKGSFAAAVLLLGLLALPAHAQDLTQAIVKDVGSGTIAVTDGGHIAFQWGPAAAMAAVQPVRLANGQLGVTGLKTGGVGLQLAMSFWPHHGEYKAHLALMGLVGFGSANAGAAPPLSGIIGLVPEWGGFGQVPLFGLGIGQPIGGAGVKQPMLLVTISVVNLFAKVGLASK